MAADLDFSSKTSTYKYLVCVCANFGRSLGVTVQKERRRETEATERTPLGGWSSRAPLACRRACHLGPGGMV